MSKGFYIPNSVNSDFVANQRNAGGNYKWDQAVDETGLNQQAALQNISKQYNNTINAAYSNYLNANRGIKGSLMGQGYKEAYMQQTQNQLQEQLAETNMSVGNIRNQLAGDKAAAVDKIGEQFELEVGNMDRVAHSMNSYLGYLGSLTNRNDPTKAYLSPDQIGQSVDTMYGTLFQAQPQDYLDAEGNMGMSYIDWVQTNLKDNAVDKAWSEWLFAYGGYNQFKEATKKGVKPL